MRPSVKAGLLPVWRDRDTIQFGVDPRRAVALGGLGQAAAVISLLDGSRDRDALIGTAQAYGVPPQATDRVLGLLAAAGVLDDFPARLHAALPDQLRARLAPELATASLAYADGDGGARTLARRQAAFVRVHGAGRTGACLASLLAASGVGHVTCTDPEPAEPADLAPAGLLLADLGAPRAEGAARAIGRAAPEVSTHDDGAVPDLAVLTGPALPDLADGLLHDRVPHLAVRATEAIGVVGPLVQPAVSACLSCVDRHKADGDPQWPKVLAQVTFSRVQPQACDTVLAAMTAAVAAGQALAFIDRVGVTAAGPGGAGPGGAGPGGAGPGGAGPGGAGPLEPGTVNGTLELVLPGWQWRRRTWRPHPGCRCGAGSGRRH
jgi:ThiF family